MTEYTHDVDSARAKLRRNAVEAVVILPDSPYQTIASGRQARIQVLYNQIDPLWRWVVPNFVQVLAGEINREIFFQNLGQQQTGLGKATSDIDLVLRALDAAIAAADEQNRAEARQQVREAQAGNEHLAETLVDLGPESAPLRATVSVIRDELRAAQRRLDDEQQGTATPARLLSQDLGLAPVRERVRQLRDILGKFVSVSPEVLISPVAVETHNIARLTPDIVTFYAPAILALLTQHIAVSLGALALVRERLSGSFELYTIAPISAMQMLLGKYLAYVLFTLAITTFVLAAVLSLLGVPLLGSPWRLAMTLVVLAVALVGMGFVFSLLASSERQAIQLAMLVLLGVVFFSGFTLPLAALRPAALVFSYVLPATYAVTLLQDIMLRGVPGRNTFLLSLTGSAVVLFATCLALLRWRMRAH